MSDIVLRSYQKNVVESIYESQKRGINRQLVVMATGLGKSLTLTQIILDHVANDKKVLVLVDQLDLVDQWKDYIRSMNPTVTIGIEQGDNKAKKTDSVVIATVQTLGRKGVKRIKRFPPDHFSFSVVDEADKSITPTWFRVLNYFGFGNTNFTNGNLLTACTATPYRNDGAKLSILYDDVVANYDTAYAMKEGWLTDIVLHEVQTNIDLSSYKNQGEFDEAVDNAERNAIALKSYKEYCEGEQCLIYCAGVDHAYSLKELFESESISCEVIEANTDKTNRKQHLEDYKSKNIQVILNHSTMTRGVDLPETSCLMLLRKITSKNLLQQILGRGIRPSSTSYIDSWDTPEDRLAALELSEKPFCKVIDLYDKVGKHNFAHIPSLFGLNNELKAPKEKRFFKEVVEPIDRAKKEHGIDPTAITDLKDIDLIVKTRKIKIKSLRLSPEVSNFTDRTWLETDNGYEIIYGDENKSLIIDKNRSKDELLGKEEWELLEYDTKSEITKRLQTFNSLSGAFNIGDKYADQQGWENKYQKKAEWQEKGVSEGQMKLLNRFFRYKSGFSEFKLLDERYEDTGLRKIFWKDSNEILNSGTASKLISNFLNNK